MMSSKTATLTPLSSCTKGRITSYVGWEKGGSCSFGPKTEEVVLPGYMFGAAPNWAFYNNATKCGVCYEMVGPVGTLRFRVEDSCPADANNIPCQGDMIHFDLHSNAQQYVAEHGMVNVTFRMVACDYPEGTKIKTVNYKSSNPAWFAFVVNDHYIGVKSVLMKDSDLITDFVSLNRTWYNTWEFQMLQPGKTYFYSLKTPITLKIYSINDDFVTVTVTNTTGGAVNVADGNFKVADGLFYNVETLQKITKPKNEPECCTLWDDYSVLYQDSIIGVYNNWSYKSTINFKSTNSPKVGKYCIDMTADAFGALQLATNFAARADQYSAIQFYVRGTVDSERSLLVRAYKTTGADKFVPVKKNTWTYYKFLFSELNITNNSFWGFTAINQNSSTNTYSFDEVTLIKNEDAPDIAMCWDNGKGTKDGCVKTEVMWVVTLLVFVILL
ncbi:hypothetical protein EIN_292540 [Entamoeba invadens IP1]|uniref:Expansin-like EG45 domain-containing protein n=1 Tax=Entamoeba invadens IP1 TaxID=370355 RepID=A0A0A1UAQ1_ENTIV|nr:hypothetical protein EIN_292540 [Entamoeba invadens IP1]ELP92055.1 hypothetical protein EIN_292540 [Entamoeba invadens IP1]|eukprot:XP_004258826.1 hypothetical protein EIN_292540 [Entamoeba invadens IP1]